MKKHLIIIILILMAMSILCSCADNANVSPNDDKNVSMTLSTEETSPSEQEPAITDTSEPIQEVTVDNNETSALDDDYTAYVKFYDDLRSRPDGKEVTIFADNTHDCDYEGYKEIGYDFYTLRYSVMAPKDWYGYRFYWDEPVMENMLTGIPIYNGPVPAEIDYNDQSSLYAPKPESKSTFFLAESPWMRPWEYLGDLISKYDHETYVDKKGRSMQVYFVDGLPKFACYDDYFLICVKFNLESDEQIPIVVNMINSIDVSLTSDSEHALYLAEKLGYTIIAPDDTVPGE